MQKGVNAMIIGIGHDLTNFERIEKLLGEQGERFTKKYFTPIEIARAERLRHVGGHVGAYTKRFAAKEATAKALGTGFSQGVYMKDIGVDNDKNGQPFLTLTNGAMEKLQSLIPEGYTARLHITLTDEPPLADAMVMIEALPDQSSGI